MAVEGEDAIVGNLEGPAKLGRGGLEGFGNDVGRHPQGSRAHTVEALRAVADSGVTPRPYVGQDGLDSGRGRLLGRRRPGQRLSPPVWPTAKVESFQHERPPIVLWDPMSSSGSSPGSSPAAELSSLATALEELSQRVTNIADAYVAAKRDDLAGELYQAERSLAGARRNLGRVVSAER